MLQSGAVAIYNTLRQDEKPFHIGDLICNGTEETIFDCPYNRDTVSQGCSPYTDDARVRCTGKYLPYMLLFLRGKNFVRMLAVCVRRCLCE